MFWYLQALALLLVKFLFHLFHILCSIRGILGTGFRSSVSLLWFRGHQQVHYFFLFMTKMTSRLEDYSTVLVALQYQLRWRLRWKYKILLVGFEQQKNWNFPLGQTIIHSIWPQYYQDHEVTRCYAFVMLWCIQVLMLMEIKHVCFTNIYQK